MHDLERADVLICGRGLAASRTRAQAMIKAGFAYVENERILKSSQLIDPDANIEIRGNVCPYVSRGGFKLQKAIDVFGIDPTGCTCIDIGASTGGFTDVLLQNGASCVYAVDVGTSQLDESIRDDPRVVVMEQTNARTLSGDMFDPLPSLAVMDVSFISIRLILPALKRILAENGALVTLIKPQFEAGRKLVGKKGIVSDRKTHIKVISDVITESTTIGWQTDALTFSPITGSDGNIEFLALMRPVTIPRITVDMGTILSVVDQAHKHTADSK